VTQEQQPKNPADSDRYERERAFHDARFTEDDRPSNRFYEQVHESSMGFVREAIDSLAPDAKVLEFGCGPKAEAAIRAASGGRQAVAFDLSPVAIEEARADASARGFGDRIDFHVMNAEEVQLPAAQFDAVFGAGILHHLDLRQAYGQIARLLRADGRAVFVEPMGHNAIINLYRQRTPGDRTSDEHPLLVEDLALGREYFEDVQPNYFGLASLLTLPVERMRKSAALVQRLDTLDRLLFHRVPAIGRYAWLVALDLQRPRSRNDEAR